jgi:hypothetical protein
MNFDDCYRVCGDRSELVLKKIGFRYSNVLLDKRRAVERAISLDVKFALDLSRGRFGISRYSDGSWPVLYTALDSDTSFHEVAFHARKEWLIGMRHGATVPKFKSSRKLLYVLGVDSTSQLDHVSPDPNLVSADYSYCHAIAAGARSAGFASLKVPSARRRTGVCVPVFDRSAVRSRTSISVHCLIRWYPLTDQLVHFANLKNEAEPIDLWHK